MRGWTTPEPVYRGRVWPPGSNTPAAAPFSLVRGIEHMVDYIAGRDRELLVDPRHATHAQPRRVDRTSTGPFGDECEDAQMAEPTAGFGHRHPDLTVLLRERVPVATGLATWGELRLRISAYLPGVRLPDQLITSVRCLVGFDHRLVVTASPDDVNVWPGGRREPGESLRQTAIREVQEETGCQLDPSSLDLMGFLHFEHLSPPPAGYPYPHPDFLQLVFSARARNAPHDDWRDVDGYVQRAWLETPTRARELPLDPVSIPFVDAFESIRRPPNDEEVPRTPA